MTLVPFFPFLYSTHSAYPIHMQTLTDSHILSLSVILSLSHTCTQTCTLEKFLSSDITQPKCGGRSKVSTGLLHGVISPGMGDGRGPGVCGGGGGTAAVRRDEWDNDGDRSEPLLSGDKRRWWTPVNLAVQAKLQKSAWRSVSAHSVPSTSHLLTTKLKIQKREEAQPDPAVLANDKTGHF